MENNGFKTKFMKLGKKKVKVILAPRLSENERMKIERRLEQRLKEIGRQLRAKGIQV